VLVVFTGTRTFSTFLPQDLAKRGKESKWGVRLSEVREGRTHPELLGIELKTPFFFGFLDGVVVGRRGHAV
jgi:hypothetical protein